jgi:HemY protein
MTFGLLFILSLALGSIAGNFLLANNGYVLINFSGYTIEMSVPILFFLMLTGYTLIRLLVVIWKTPMKLGELTAGGRVKRANKSITRGYIELAEGNFEKGEKLLTNGIRSCEAPLLNYLAAARAAQAQGQIKRRDNWLKMACKHEPEAANAILLTQAEFQLQNNETQEAQKTLELIILRSHHSGEAVRLLGGVYLQKGDWQMLSELLPKLRKRLNKEQFRIWSISCFKGLLCQAGSSKAKIDNVWKQIPRNLRLEHDLVLAHIEAVTLAGEYLEAERLIRRSIERRFDSRLIRCYGLVLTEKPEKLLNHSERWLKERPEEPILLLTIGRLCIKAKLWGKAYGYIERSIAILPTPETYSELGQLMLKMEKPLKASEAFRQGLELKMQSNTPFELETLAERRTNK